MEPIHGWWGGVCGMRGREGRKGERLGKAGKKPGFEDIGAEVKGGDLGREEPVESDLGLEGGDVEEGGGGGVFHVEHQVDLMVWLAVRTEADLGDGKEGAGVECEAGFLEELPGECARSGLVEFNVAAGQVVIALGDVATEEHGAVGGSTEKCARKELGLPIICHDAEPVPPWNVFHGMFGMGHGRLMRPGDGGRVDRGRA